MNVTIDNITAAYDALVDDIRQGKVVELKLHSQKSKRVVALSGGIYFPNDENDKYEDNRKNNDSKLIRLRAITAIVQDYGGDIDKWWDSPGHQGDKSKKWAVFSEVINRVNHGIIAESKDKVDDRFYEGKCMKMHCDQYERNRKAREECLKHYGHVCAVCGKDFSKEYNGLGKSAIEVHHHVKISSYKGVVHGIDPIKDLVPVCSNCHAILHSKDDDEPYGISELKALLGVE